MAFPRLSLAITDHIVHRFVSRAKELSRLLGTAHFLSNKPLPVPPTVHSASTAVPTAPSTVPSASTVVPAAPLTVHFALPAAPTVGQPASHLVSPGPTVGGTQQPTASIKTPKRVKQLPPLGVKLRHQRGTPIGEPREPSTPHQSPTKSSRRKGNLALPAQATSPTLRRSTRHSNHPTELQLPAKPSGISEGDSAVNAPTVLEVAVTHDDTVNAVTASEVAVTPSAAEATSNASPTASREWDILTKQVSQAELIQFATTHQVQLTPPNQSATQNTAATPPLPLNLENALFPTPANKLPLSNPSAGVPHPAPPAFSEDGPITSPHPKVDKKKKSSKDSKRKDSKGKSKAAAPAVLDDVFSPQGIDSSPTLSTSGGSTPAQNGDPLHSLCLGDDEENRAEIDDAVDAIIKLAEAAAAQLDILPSRIYSALDERIKEPKLSGLTASNAWNMFQPLYKHRPYVVQEMLKRAGSTIVTDDALLLYQEFIAKVDNWDHVLRTNSNIADTVEQEENYRKRRKSIKKKGDEIETYLAHIAKRYGFEGVFTLVGSNVNEDLGLTRFYATPAARGFFWDRLRALDSAVVGQLRAHVFDKVSKDFLTQLEALRAKTGIDPAGLEKSPPKLHPPSPTHTIPQHSFQNQHSSPNSPKTISAPASAPTSDPSATASASTAPVTATAKGTASSSKLPASPSATAPTPAVPGSEDTVMTGLRKDIVRLTKPMFLKFNIKVSDSYFPWANLPHRMMKAGVSLHNYPHGVPFFGEGSNLQPSVGSGCRVIGIDNLRKLVDAFGSKSPPEFRPEDQPALEKSKLPMFVETNPPPDSDATHGRRKFFDNKSDFHGPPRRQAHARATSTTSHLGPIATSSRPAKRTALIISDDEDDAPLTRGSLPPSKKQKTRTGGGGTIETIRLGTTRKKVLFDDADEEHSNYNPPSESEIDTPRARGKRPADAPAESDVASKKARTSPPALASDGTRNYAQYVVLCQQSGMSPLSFQEFSQLGAS